MVLGDKNLLLSLHTPCSKDKQAVAQAKKDGKKKKFNNSATIVKKPESYVQPAQEERREPTNLTGIPNDELFGPSWINNFNAQNVTEKKTVYANPVVVKPREKYTLQSEDESECSVNSERDGDDEIQYTICGVGIPANKEQEHINANHSSEDESTAPKVREEKICPQQKKKKVKMYKSSLDSESEDNGMVTHIGYICIREVMAYHI